MSTTRLFVVPDPLGPATYQTTDHAEGVFLGTDLVEIDIDPDSGVVSLNKVGDLNAEGDPELIAATEPMGNLDQIITNESTVWCLFSHLDGSDVAHFQWWQVDADGSNAVLDIDQDYAVSNNLPYVITPENGRALTPRAIALQIDDPARNGDFQDLPAGTSFAFLPSWNDSPENEGRPGSPVNINASTWGAFVIGDEATEPSEVIPPEPFDVTSTIASHPDAGNVFCWWLDEPGDTVSNWDGAIIHMENVGGYGGDIPDLTLDIFAVGTILALDPSGHTTVSGDDIGFTAINDINTAYHVTPGSPPHARPGSLSVAYNAVLFPGVGADFFDKMAFTVTKTTTITPDAPTRYRQGQYRYFNATLDETSAYDTEHLPSTGYMESDYFDAIAGRWTLVVGKVQDGDNFGGDNQGSFAVHFEPFAGISGRMGLARVRFY